jgi:DNA mismatch repair ATPase MutS
MHYLGAIGCLVPGREATLLQCDGVFTHFERPEKIENLRGKLHDDLVRIHGILSAATSRSVIIMNEIFSSTSLEDATYLGRAVMERIMDCGALAVCVTFMDELAALGPRTVSMVATVAPDEPTRRTFKIHRKPAEGIAYALSLAERRRVTYEWVKKRVSS